MNREDPFDRVLGALHEVAFDAIGWPAAAALIDALCGVKSNAIVFAGGRPPHGAEVYLYEVCTHGHRREDLEQIYLNDYWHRDERVPRLRQLPDSLLVPVRDLYTEAERRTSATYNEALPRSDSQDGLQVRLDGPGGTRVIWATGNPVDAGGWSDDRIRMIERLLPHVRQCVLFRHALIEARALGESLAGLLEVTGMGVVQLDGRGRIVTANDRAVELLRRGVPMSDRDGGLHAAEPADNARLQQLLVRAVLPVGQGAAGSMLLGRPFASPRLVLHVTPVGGRLNGRRMRRVAAVVLIRDLARKPRIDEDAVASALGLTPSEGSVAAMLAGGYTLREIAAATGRREGTIRWHLKQIFAKQGVSRQADVVRLVLTVPGAAVLRR
ncbi:MAG: LuxR C-terminal-related transcriptional regulator [Acidobacteria bacterium]|nr:LuxR C-terminal-related transcriptional regulator [Acidobacteriota bacterium]